MSDRRLTPELLLGAYASGIFPMAETRDDPEVYWVDPQYRGILPLDGLHLSRSLARRMRQGEVTATLDVAFDEIVDGCAARDETWINDTIRDLMSQLYVAGYAHAFGVWRGNSLIGGMYGLTIGGAFFGESMFSAATDGSKMTLAFAVDHLRRTGFTLFDTQFLTPHLASLGAVEIPRAAYHKRLAEALSRPADIHAIPLETDPQAVVQRITQTS
ncbi:MAG: leucyl/phenylalanyl-tRNA--protein transferase [Silicimonas sp.]|nr:leucyl/phenylalanyl-tRNA--protein transferase [Silicimonas sp.]